jgi:hypothetical protein
MFSGEASTCGKLLRVIRYDEELMDTSSVSQQRVIELLMGWSWGDVATLTMDSNKKLCYSRPTFLT